MLDSIIPIEAGGAIIPGHFAPDVTPFSPLLIALAAALPFVTPAVMPLYRRIARRRVLASPTRRAILDAFTREPGSTAAAVAGALAVDYKTVQHHARVLREFHLVTARRDGRLIRYYPLAGPAAATRTLKYDARVPGFRE
jgi:DNA-binding transcriptional ArsR family regulator